MCVPCDETFPSIPKILTLWHWPWLLTSFWKKLNITFESRAIRLSDHAWIFLLARPFVGSTIFEPMTLTVNFDLLLKKVNLGINFKLRDKQAFILLICISCDKTFLSVPNILSSDLDLLLKKKVKNLTFALTFEWKEILRYYKSWGGGISSASLVLHLSFVWLHFHEQASRNIFTRIFCDFIPILVIKS